MRNSLPPSIRVATVLVMLIGLAAGGFAYQRHYLLSHLPLIQAALPAADRRGAALMEEIGAPAGAKPFSPVEKKTFNGRYRGMWRDTPGSVHWTREWEAPGLPDAIMDWYRQHLLATGWKVYHQRVPSQLEDLYWQDKWLLTVERSASFATDRPPHARVRLRLIWDYWHRLEETSAAYAPK